MAGMGTYFGQNAMAQPYAGPTRAGDGDPAFESWRQRQFSSAPFTQDELNRGVNVMPRFAGGDGASASKPWQNPASWDPRSITQSDPFKRLMELSGSGGGVVKRAREDAGPSMNFYRESLASGDPLGTAMLPQLTEQRGFSALRDAGKTANRQIDESAGGMNAMANPAMQQFLKALAGFSQAGGVGEVARSGAETKISERAATKSFQQAVAQALAQLSGMFGGLDMQRLGLQQGAAATAGGLESSANNTWANAMLQLLMQQNRPTESRALRGTDGQGRDMYDQNPFKGGYDFGSYLNGRNF